MTRDDLMGKDDLPIYLFHFDLDVVDPFKVFRESGQLVIVCGKQRLCTNHFV